MGDSEKHQCRVCDIIFHSYEELERHCSLHIKTEKPEIRLNLQIMSNFAIGTSSDSVVDSKVGISLVPKTEVYGNSENCSKLPDSTNVVQSPKLSNIKVEMSDSNVLPGTSVPSIINIKVEKPDKAVVLSDPQPDKVVIQSDPQLDKAVVLSDPQPDKAVVLSDPQLDKAVVLSDPQLDKAVVQSDAQSDKAVVQSDPQPDKAVVQSDPQPSSSTQNGFTRLVKQPLIITRPTEPSEIILKFPNIFSAISKPPASLHNQPQVPVAKRKQKNSDNEKGRVVIKRCRLPETGFACHLCGERFNKKDKLRQHMHSHMKEKFFKCDICGEKYLDKTQLDLHRPKHFFRCENCGQGFVKYADLKAHSVKHDSVSKFTCFVCRKSFPYKSVLMAHIDIHNTGAFECDHCFAKFNGRSQLSKHYFAHHSTAKKETQITSNPLSSGSGTKIKTVNNDSKKSDDNTTGSESFQNISVKIKAEMLN